MSKPKINKIHIDDQYAIGSTPNQWILYRIYINKDGSTTYQAEAYAGLEGIIKRYFKSRVNTMPYDSLQDIVDNIRSVREDISKFLEREGFNFTLDLVEKDKGID